MNMIRIHNRVATHTYRSVSGVIKVRRGSWTEGLRIFTHRTRCCTCTPAFRRTTARRANACVFTHAGSPSPPHRPRRDRHTRAPINRCATPGNRARWRNSIFTRCIVIDPDDSSFARVTHVSDPSCDVLTKKQCFPTFLRL